MEQAVIIHLRLSEEFGSSEDQEAVYELEDNLTKTIEETSLGEFDGDEFGGGECVLYMYGPDADKLFAAIKPILKSCSLASGGYAIKRYGEPDDRKARQVRVKL